MSLQAFQVDVDTGLQLHPDYVVTAGVRCRRPAMFDQCDVRGALYNGLRVQEADGEFGIAAGRAHRDRYAAVRTSATGFVAQPDLQRLLDGHKIVTRLL